MNNNYANFVTALNNSNEVNIKVINFNDNFLLNQYKEVKTVLNNIELPNNLNIGLINKITVYDFKNNTIDDIDKGTSNDNKIILDFINNLELTQEQVIIMQRNKIINTSKETFKTLFAAFMKKYNDNVNINHINSHFNHIEISNLDNLEKLSIIFTNKDYNKGKSIEVKTKIIYKGSNDYSRFILSLPCRINEIKRFEVLQFKFTIDREKNQIVNIGNGKRCDFTKETFYPELKKLSGYNDMPNKANFHELVTIFLTNGSEVKSIYDTTTLNNRFDKVVASGQVFDNKIEYYDLYN